MRKSIESVEIEILKEIFITPIVADARMLRYGVVVKVNVRE
jgi:hypothetical protein